MEHMDMMKVVYKELEDGFYSEDSETSNFKTGASEPEWHPTEYVQAEKSFRYEDEARKFADEVGGQVILVLMTASEDEIEDVTEIVRYSASPVPQLTENELRELDRELKDSQSIVIDGFWAA